MTGEELEALARRAFEGLGLARDEAVDAARILVLADLFGHATHGVSRIESYGERIDAGGIDPRARVAVEDAAPAVARVDGANGVGPVVGMHALRAALDRARRLGVGVALARHSNHFGAVGPYCWLATRDGFALIAGSNASTTIAPTGGREARLGNSPFAIGVPRPGGRPVILDMAMSVVARAKIRSAVKRGEAIPDTWATDRDGKPTTDPKRALDGFLLPAGGYKGYGLALMVDLLAGVLSGAGYLTRVKSWLDEPEEPSDIGHFFVAIDTARLGPPDALAQRVADFADIVHGTPRADPSVPVRLPGEIELDHYDRHRRDGIEIPAELRAKLEAYAARAR